MRLTQTLRFRYAKYYYWGFGKGDWGERKMKDIRHREWRLQLKSRGNRKVPYTLYSLPEGAVVHDALKFATEPDQSFDFSSTYVWPFEPKPEEGSPNDPKYKAQRANVFDRKTIILEGYKGACNFSNTVIESESESPEVVKCLQNQVELDSDFMDLVNRRINWCRSDDSLCIPLPRIREFPRLNFNLKRTYGVGYIRTEFNTLLTFYDLSDLFAACNFGFFDRRKVVSPKCLLTFERDQQSAICNLNCDFITLSAHKDQKPLFSSNNSETQEKSLPVISPCNWEICFDKTNFYEENNEIGIPTYSNVHTIYLSTGFHHQKKFVDRFLKGRVVMFCYGYTVAEARRRFADLSDHRNVSNYGEIPEPVTVQCVFINESKTSVGFAYYQLNTLSFESNIKNQIWFEGPFDLNSEREVILQKMIAIQLLGRPLISQNIRNVS
ncbi:hypothetical protein B4U79_07015, partial [Dinothrombium tinctorium]